MMTVQLMFEEGLLVPFTNAVCKYCGKKFFKTANKTCYCSDRCRKFALREQKAKYQRERRKQIREGKLASNESKYVGTGFLSQHRQEDFSDEMEAILKEFKHLRLRRNL